MYQKNKRIRTRPTRAVKAKMTKSSVFTDRSRTIFAAYHVGDWIELRYSNGTRSRFNTTCHFEERRCGESTNAHAHCKGHCTCAYHVASRLLALHNNCAIDVSSFAWGHRLSQLSKKGLLESANMVSSITNRDHLAIQLRREVTSFHDNVGFD